MSLRKATVNKFSNEIACTIDANFTAYTRELIVAACTEFVQLLSSKGNEIFVTDKNKLITTEHFLRALVTLPMERLNIK